MSDVIMGSDNTAVGLTAEPKTRLASVDCLRGLAIAGMILANNPGDGGHVYRELEHAVWNGWTLADFVFPLFLFLVGVCVALAVDRDAVRAGERPGFWRKVLKRAALLFALGLLENLYLFLQVEHLRIPGVLQRIAVVYLATVWLHVRLGDRAVLATIGSVLLGYWLLLAFVPVPGFGQPSLSREVNLEGWLDQLLLHGHTWRFPTTWDPEGVLSTGPAVALGLIGLLSGHWLRRGGGGIVRAVAIGAGMAALGLLWNPWFPINKSLCTSSFVLLTAGVGLMLLTVGHGLLDGRRSPAWAKPLAVLGTNPLSIYVLASFVASTLRHIRLADGTGERVKLQVYLFREVFAAWSDPYLASLAWGLLFLLALWLVALALYARRIVIKL